jgi:hypothetical protein
MIASYLTNALGVVTRQCGRDGLLRLELCGQENFADRASLEKSFVVVSTCSTITFLLGTTEA